MSKAKPKKQPKKLYAVWSSGADDAYISSSLKACEQRAQDWWHDLWNETIYLGQITVLKHTNKKRADIPWQEPA